MKKIITISLILLVFLFLLVGCGKFNKNQEKTPQGIPKEEKKNDVAALPPLKPAQPFSFNIPDKSLEQNLKISGKVASEHRIFINEKEFLVDLDGNFNGEIALVPGDNLFAVKVISSDGKSIYTTSKTVVYDPKPKLQVKEPNQISGESLNIEGSTDPDCIINVNGYQTRADEKGNFKITIPSIEGNKSVKIVSTNKAGKASTVQKTITQTTN